MRVCPLGVVSGALVCRTITHNLLLLGVFTHLGQSYKGVGAGGRRELLSRQTCCSCVTSASYQMIEPLFLHLQNGNQMICLQRIVEN